MYNIKLWIKQGETRLSLSDSVYLLKGYEIKEALLT